MGRGGLVRKSGGGGVTKTTGKNIAAVLWGAIKAKAEK